MKRTILLTLLACMLFFIAFASPSLGFVSVSEQSTSLVTCIEQTGPQFTIYNEDTVSHSYSFGFSGSGASFIAVPALGIVLEPGQSYSLDTVARIPCGKQGSYDVILTAQLDNGVTQKITAELVIAPLQNIELMAIEHSKQIIPCQTASYSYVVKNSGPFTETYTVTFDSELAQYANVSFSSIELGPGQEYPLDFFVTPACSVYGNYSIPFSVTTTTTKLAAKTEAFISIEQAYNFNLILGEAYYDMGDTTTGTFVEADTDMKYKFCTEADYIVPARLVNEVPVPNTYEVSLDAPDFVTLSETSISLNGSEEKIIGLGISTRDINPSEGEFLVTIPTEIGDVLLYQNVSYEIVNCYVPELVAESGKKKSVVTYDNERIPFVLKNTGSDSVAYSISVEGPGFVSVSPSTVTLAGDAEESVYVLTRPTETDSGSHAFTVVVSPTDSSSSFSFDHKVALKGGLLSTIWYDYGIFVIIALVLIVVLIGMLIMLSQKKSGKKKRVKKTETKTTKKIQKGLPTWLRKLLIIVILIVFFAAVYFAVYYFTPAAIWNPYRYYISIGMLVLLLLLVLLVVFMKSAKSHGQKKGKPIKKETKKVTQKTEKKVVQKTKVQKKSKKINKNVLKALLLVLILLVVAALGVGVWYFFDTLSDFFVDVWDVVSTFFVDYWLYIAIAVGSILAILLVLFIVWKIKKGNRVHIPVKQNTVSLDLRKYKKYALGEVLLSLRRTYITSAFTLSKVKNPTFLKPKGIVYEYFNAGLKGLDDEDVKEVSFRFAVSKKWIAKHNVMYKSISLKRYENSWQNLKTQYVSQDDSYYYYEATSSACSYFAIVGNQSAAIPAFSAAEERKLDQIAAKAHKKYKPASNRVFTILLVILILLLVLFFGGWLFVRFFDQGIMFIKDYGWYLLGGIVVLLLVLFGMLKYITRPEKKVKKQKKGVPKAVWIVLSIALIVLLAWLFWPQGGQSPERLGNETMPIANESPVFNASDAVINDTPEVIAPVEKEYNDTEGIPAQVWEEDTVKEIDLSTYFSDPDNETLIFSNSELRDISVTYEGAVAYLKPAKDFFGSEYVIFTAEDSAGAQVESNLIRLTVTDVAEPPLHEEVLDWIVQYQTFIVLGIAFLLVILLGVVGIKSLSKK